MRDWNFELTVNGTQKFAIKPPEILSVGDYVTIDGATGKLRRMVPGEDITGFAIPPHAEIDLLNGVLVIPDTSEMQKEMTMEKKLRPVPTDKGIEGLAEIAQAALAANYGDAKSAIADAVRHMRRIIRKAEAQDGEWQVVKVEPTRGAHIDFTGRLIGQNRFVTDSDDPMLITMKVWQTKGGAYVAEFTSRPEYGDGFVNIRAEVFPLIDDVQEMRFGVMDFFDWTDGARSMARKMDWKLRRDVP